MINCLNSSLLQEMFQHLNDVTVVMSKILAYYGVGGIIGNVIVGNLLTFGPLRGRNFEVFIVNNIILLVMAGMLVFR